MSQPTRSIDLSFMIPEQEKPKEKFVVPKKFEGNALADIKNNDSFRAACFISAFGQTFQEKRSALLMLKHLLKNSSDLALMKDLDHDLTLEYANTYSLGLREMKISAKMVSDTKGLQPILDFLVTYGIKFVQFDAETLLIQDPELLQTLDHQITMAASAFASEVAEYSLEYMRDTIKRLAPMWDLEKVPPMENLDWTWFLQQSGLEAFLNDSPDWKRVFLFKKDNPNGSSPMLRNYPHKSYFPSGGLGDVAAVTGAFNELFEDPLVVVCNTDEIAEIDLARGLPPVSEIPSNFLMCGKDGYDRSISMASLVASYPELDKNFQDIKEDVLQENAFDDQSLAILEAKTIAFGVQAREAYERIGGLETHRVEDPSIPYRCVLEIYQSGKSDLAAVKKYPHLAHIVNLSVGVSARAKVQGYLFIVDPSCHLAVFIPPTYFMYARPEYIQNNKLEVHELKLMKLFPAVSSKNLAQYHDVHRALLNLSVIDRFSPMTNEQHIALLQEMLSLMPSAAAVEYMMELYELVFSNPYKDVPGKTLAPVGKKRRGGANAIDTSTKMPTAISLAESSIPAIAVRSDSDTSPSTSSGFFSGVPNIFSSFRGRSVAPIVKKRPRVADRPTEE